MQKGAFDADAFSPVASFYPHTCGFLSALAAWLSIQVSTMLSDVFSASACDLLPTRNSFDGLGLGLG